MPKEILIVDDEPSIVVPVQFLMQQQGYSVLVAGDGHDALDMIYKYQPDLVLLDIMLPGMDGFEVLQRLRANHVDTPVLVQSALVDRDFAIQGMSLGVDDYMIKPYSQIELAVRIESALNRACSRTLADGEARPAQAADRKERRRNGRKIVQKIAEIRGPEADRAMECMIINLSDDGAALKPADPPSCPPRFKLQVSDEVVHSCEVSWRYRNKVGVHFVEA